MICCMHGETWSLCVCVNVCVFCCALPVVLLGSALLQSTEVPQRACAEERRGTRQAGPHQ